MAGVGAGQRPVKFIDREARRDLAARRRQHQVDVSRALGEELPTCGRQVLRRERCRRVPLGNTSTMPARAGAGASARRPAAVSARSRTSSASASASALAPAAAARSSAAALAAAPAPLGVSGALAAVLPRLSRSAPAKAAGIPEAGMAAALRVRSRRSRSAGLEATPLKRECPGSGRRGRRSTPGFPAFPGGARECREWDGAAAPHERCFRTWSCAAVPTNRDPVGVCVVAGVRLDHRPDRATAERHRAPHHHLQALADQARRGRRPRRQRLAGRALHTETPCRSR